jgi:two-component system, NtrC family, sensor kinase
MKLIFKVFFFLLIPVFVTAQQDPFVEMWSVKQIDSLKEEWKHTADNDTMRMRLSRSFGWYYQEIDRDSSLYFQSIQLKLARKLKLKLWEADALDQGGWVLAQLKNYPLSLQYFLAALEILQNKDCEKNIWLITLFSKDKDPEKARLTCLASTHNDLATLYTATGNKAEELSNLLQGFKIAQHINNSTMMALITMNTGGAYLRRGQTDSALIYLRVSQDNMIKSGYRTYEGEALNTLGDIFTGKKDYKLAKHYYDLSISANKQNNVATGIPSNFLSLANLYVALGKDDSAVYYTREAINGFKKVNNYTGLSRAYRYIAALKNKASNPDSAYFFLQLYTILNDSLARAEKEKIDAYQNVGFNQQKEMQQRERKQIQKENTVRTYVLLSGIGIFMLIAFLLYRNNRNRKKANQLLQNQKEEIELQKKNVEKTLSDLKATQSQLIQSEKMASLGELTAGIAHEIQNPLNFVNNFSEVNTELIEELKSEKSKVKSDRDEQLEDELLNDIAENEKKINHHGKRADAIVKGMLQHSQNSVGVKEPTDINKLADEYLRLAYHGLRAKDKSFNATLKTDYDDSIGNINVIPQDIGRVILNLITNAFYVVDEKKKQQPDGYEPTVLVSTKKINDTIEIKVSDNGNGIPKKVLDKIFQPFFTTKPTGVGTGLGLSLSYDIVKAHGGELKVETKEGEGSTFIISLTR